MALFSTESLPRRQGMAGEHNEPTVVIEEHVWREVPSSDGSTMINTLVVAAGEEIPVSKAEALGIKVRQDKAVENKVRRPAKKAAAKPTESKE